MELKIPFKYESFSLLKNSIIFILQVSPIQATLLLSMIITQSILPIASVKVVSLLVDSMTSRDVSASNILSLVFGWGILLFIHDIVTPFILFLQSNIADKVVCRVNNLIIKKSNSIEGIELFETSKFHNSIQMLLSESSSRPISLVVTLLGLLKDLILICACISVLFHYLGWISFIPLIGAIIHSIIMAKIHKSMWLESLLGTNPKKRFMNYIVSLTINSEHAKELRLFPLGSYLLKKYNKLFSEIYKKMFRLRLQQVCLPLIPITIYVSANIYGLYYVSQQIMQEIFSIGIIIMIIQTLSYLHSSVSNLGEQYGWLWGHLKFFENFFYFLKLEERLFPCSKTKEIQKISTPISIEFKNVSFIYPDSEKLVLDNISFKIDGGEKLVIIGHNGSGKTTIAKLICGFYKASSGKILINDIPIEDYSLPILRERIAPIFQDFGKYALSVEQNITMNEGSKHSVKLLQIIEEADATDFVQRLSSQEKTKLGKNFGGAELSGGEWQKLAIARALHKDSDILIWDEPTASLNPISDKAILDNFAKSVKKQTTLFITHRYTSIHIADRVLLLNKGRISALGKHEDLIKSSILYKTMFEASFSKL